MLLTPFRAQVITLLALPIAEGEQGSNLLCPVRAFRVYLECSSLFRQSEKLFICFRDRHKGLPVKTLLLDSGCNMCEGPLHMNICQILQFGCPCPEPRFPEIRERALHHSLRYKLHANRWLSLQSNDSDELRSEPTYIALGFALSAGIKRHWFVQLHKREQIRLQYKVKQEFSPYAFQCNFFSSFLVTYLVSTGKQHWYQSEV